MNKDPARERYFFYNTLSILLKAVQNKYTNIELQNEASIYGLVEHVDAYMNVSMKDCVFTDPKGNTFQLEVFFVQAKNIKYVQIPNEIIPAMKEGLQQLSDSTIETEKKKRTYKMKRTKQMQQEGIIEVQKILESRKVKDSSDTGKE